MTIKYEPQRRISGWVDAVLGAKCHMVGRACDKQAYWTPQDSIPTSIVGVI